MFSKISRHYLIPYHIAKSGKFGKNGTKLHIYMDHVFVAQHVKRYIMRENNKKLTINTDKICALFFQWNSMSSMSNEYSLTIGQTRL